MLSRGRAYRFITAVVAALLLQQRGIHAWTLSTSGLHHHQPHVAKRWTSSVKYAPTNMPTTETPDLVAQKMLKQTSSARKTSETRAPSLSLSLSHSAMSSCNSHSSFPTSHGLLSPETVLRMEERAVREGHKSEAVVSFLKTYKQHGPMSCLPMLSDPDILPHLTNAMRESMSC